MTEIPGVKEFFIFVAFTMPRMMAALSISPFFGDQFIGGIARQVVIMSLSLLAAPIVWQSAEGLPEGGSFSLLVLFILGKEVVLGMIIGFASGIVFWIAEGTGFFIDNQRGSSMAEMFDPMSGGSSSPFGVLFTKITGVLFFIGGGFAAFLTVMYESYNVWPVFEYFPTMRPGFPDAALGILDGIMGLIVTYAAPIILAMFLAEFGLGLMNRFSPQLNVFFLAMPVKSGIASVLIIFYLIFLVGFFEHEFITPSRFREFYGSLFE